MRIPNVNLKYCGFRFTEPPYICESHTHINWELVYYEGLGISEVNGISFNYISGSYVLIPACITHSEKALLGGNLYVIGFDTKLDYVLPNRLFFDTQEKSVKTIIDFIIKDVNKGLPYFAQRVELLMQDILLETLRQCSSQTVKSDQKLDMIINYIDAYYTMNINFEILANSLAYSYDYLRHYFKEKMNVSLKQYIINKRIALAKEYLKSDLSLIEISKRCGFSSSVYFSSAFRQIVGETPTQYRNQCKQIELVGEATLIHKENQKGL